MKVRLRLRIRTRIFQLERMREVWEECASVAIALASDRRFTYKGYSISER
jgi:hypothetical protein